MGFLEAVIILVICSFFYYNDCFRLKKCMTHIEREEQEGMDEVEGAHGAHHSPHAAHGEMTRTLATIEQAHHNKHHRVMHRTLRWPIHSNTPRITF